MDARLKVGGRRADVVSESRCPSHDVFSGRHFWSSALALLYILEKLKKKWNNEKKDQCQSLLPRVQSGVPVAVGNNLMLLRLSVDRADHLPLLGLVRPSTWRVVSVRSEMLDSTSKKLVPIERRRDCWRTSELWV